MTKSKRAIITGITGQDGSYLTKFLLAKKYQIFGIVGPYPSWQNFQKLEIDRSQVKLIESEQLGRYAQAGTEIYNFAGQTSVGLSWQDPYQTMEMNLHFYLQLLEAVKGKKAKVLQCSSVEMYGDLGKKKISETTELNPRSPYALSKYVAHHYGRMLRKSGGEFITNVILSNHESPLRDERFVLRKVIDYAQRLQAMKPREIKPAQVPDKLALGNINVARDWGFAEDYVQAMWKILQLEQAQDIVVASGKTQKLSDLIAYIFRYFGIRDFRQYITIDPGLIRQEDTPYIAADVRMLNSLKISLPAISENNINRLICL